MSTNLIQFHIQNLIHSLRMTQVLCDVMGPRSASEQKMDIRADLLVALKYLTIIINRYQESDALGSTELLTFGPIANRSLNRVREQVAQLTVSISPKTGGHYACQYDSETTSFMAALQLIEINHAKFLEESNKFGLHISTSEISH